MFAQRKLGVEYSAFVANEMQQGRGEVGGVVALKAMVQPSSWAGRVLPCAATKHFMFGFGR